MSESKSGLSLKFTYVSDAEIHYEIDLGEEQDLEGLPNQMVTILTYIRSNESLKELNSMYKRICKDLKSKDLYQEFCDLLKSMALQKLMDKSAPMISPLEVLGRKRMS